MHEPGLRLVFQNLRWWGMSFCIKAKPEQARSLLDTVITADPTNVEALVRRVRVAFMQGQDQQVIADAQKVHDMRHSGYGGPLHRCRLLPAHEPHPEMLAQLQLFLEEDPDNQLADYVRKTIAEMQGQAH